MSFVDSNYDMKSIQIKGHFLGVARSLAMELPYRQRIPGISFGNIIYTEVAAVDSPGLNGISGISS